MTARSSGPSDRGYLKTAFESGGSARTQQQSFFARGPLDQTICLFRSHFQVGIGKLRVINGGHDGRRHVLPSFEPVEGSVRLQADAANRRIQFLEAPRGADKSSAGAEPGDEMSDAPGGLFPDFVRRGLIMGAPIGRVAVLIHIKIPARLGGDNFLRAQNRSVRAFIARRDDQLGAKSLQNFLALFARARRQAKFHAIAQRRGNHGVGDPGISAGRVQDGLARLQLPRPFRFANHFQRGPVLYRAARIEPFRLAEKFHIGIVRAEALEAQKRRIANAINHIAPICSGVRRCIRPERFFCRVHLPRPHPIDAGLAPCIPLI